MSNSENQRMVTTENDDSDDDGISEQRDNNKCLSLMIIGFAEFVGTTLLLYLTCMGSNVEMSSSDSMHPMQNSMASGSALMTVTKLFEQSSGAHVNPAVTLCALIVKRISLKQASVYIATQFVGSFAGYALFEFLTPKLAKNSTHCLTLPHEGLSPLQAISIEALSTLVLTLAICVSWNSKKEKDSSSSIAMTVGIVAGCLGMASPYTGSSMNPARSFAPALSNRKFELNYIYWFGPGIGACAAGYFYRLILCYKVKKNQ